MTAQLWCFGESGNAYKAALTMELAGFPWEPVKVDFFNGEARSPAFRALNPMGEVPVLRDGDLTLTQSAVIQLLGADEVVWVDGGKVYHVCDEVPAIQTGSETATSSRLAFAPPGASPCSPKAPAATATW